MAKSSEAYFVVQFPLDTESFQVDILNKRMELGRRIYNSTVTIIGKQYREMIKTRQYRRIKAELKDIYSSESKENIKRKKELNKELNKIYKASGFTEYSFQAVANNLRQVYKQNIDTHVAQKIGTRLWMAYDDLLFGKGEKIHYKKYGTFNSLEGKSNASGLKIRKDKIEWLGLKIPIMIDYNNSYESMAIEHKISYCRIVRKWIKGRYKFYVQVVFKGTPPIKICKETGEIKHKLGNGNVGLDIGTQTIAISSDTHVDILELADRVQNIENEKRRLLRKLDRSRRAMNPNNYNEDGTIKKQGNKKVVWVNSNRYLKLQGQLREIQRKQADIRRYQHQRLANDIFILGDTFFVEQMNFKGLQRKAKDTTVNEKGRFKRKKRFGKSLANKAPSMFLTILDNKLKAYGKELIKINTYKAKASQYSHDMDDYKKKKLSQRWTVINGFEVQRDMYSAFLLMNMNEDLETFNKEKCNCKFNNFLVLHNATVERLSDQHNLSSIAI